MKILKYTLAIIAILVIVFLLIGQIKSEISYECEITVDKPVAESWVVIQDEEKLSEWLPGLQRIEHISGTPGTKGAVSDVHFDVDGEQMVIRETITDIVPNESISMTYQSDFMDMDYKLAVASMEGKTKISTSSVTWGNGIFSKSIIAFMGSSFKSQEETNLSNLKKTIEENTKNYFPVEEEAMETMEE